MELLVNLSIAFFVILVIMLIVFAKLSPKRNNYNTAPIYYESSNDSSSPKLTATVTQSFHNDVKNYCQRHKLTISDLVRTAVKKYMEENY